MKVAVMQPYLFPYIGYFQMIKAVDIFVFYDDVNFIKRGWINRNRIIVNNSPYMFTVPLDKANQLSLIKDTNINNELYESWKLKLLITLEQSYKKAPYFMDVFALVNKIFDLKVVSISELAIESVKEVSLFLGFKTEFILSSERYDNQNLHRQERLIDICNKESAIHYINALGGQELYSKEAFMLENIKLDFIKTLPIEYKQFKGEFVPWLSIIDVLMFNSVDDINIMLDKYELI